MADRHPRETTKDMVIHARNTSFAMLLVCGVVVVSALFGKDERIERAIEELDILVSIQEDVFSAVQISVFSDLEVNFVDIFGSNNSATKPDEHYKAHFLLNGEPREILESYFGAGHPAIETLQLSCTFSIDPNTKLIGNSFENRRILKVKKNLRKGNLLLMVKKTIR